MRNMASGERIGRKMLKSAPSLLAFGVAGEGGGRAQFNYFEIGESLNMLTQ